MGERAGRDRPASRIRLAAILVAIGLGIEAVSLYGSGPGAFLAFALIGATLTLAGSALAAWVLLTTR